VSVLQTVLDIIQHYSILFPLPFTRTRPRTCPPSPYSCIRNATPSTSLPYPSFFAYPSLNPSPSHRNTPAATTANAPNSLPSRPPAAVA
jgi:hypothetical protein